MKQIKNEYLELTERDKLVLNLLVKFKCLFADTIIQLGGFTDNYGSKRLAKLVRLGYIKKVQTFVNKKALYTISHKGLHTIGSKSPYYEIEGNSQSYHEAVIGVIALWMTKKYGLELSTIQTERELRQAGIKFGKGQKTQPDLLVADAIAVEYEHSAKSSERTRNKIVNNASNCKSQFWIVDEDNKALAERIQKIAKEEESEYLQIKLYILEKEQIEKELNEKAWERDEREG